MAEDLLSRPKTGVARQNKLLDCCRCRVLDPDRSFEQLVAPLPESLCRGRAAEVSGLLIR
jgi:hypothetical protein